MLISTHEVKKLRLLNAREAMRHGIDLNLMRPSS